MVLVFIGAQCQAAAPRGLSLWQGSFPGPLTLGTVRANTQHTCAQSEIGISLRNCHELAFATEKPNYHDNRGKSHSFFAFYIVF